MTARRIGLKLISGLQTKNEERMMCGSACIRFEFPQEQKTLISMSFIYYL
jgi:hypothetical protein